MPGGDGEYGAAVPVPGSVAIVTDSSATMPADAAASARVHVVPLRLLAGELVADDGDADSAAAVEVAAARGERLTTARPAPERFAAAYRAAAAAGASAVLSVHLSGLLSGTVSSAALAAADSPIPVRVLDSRTIGTGLGLVVEAAAAAVEAGLGLDEAAAMAASHAERVGSFFALDRPDALLASGRIPAAPPGLPGGQAQAGLVSRSILRIRSGQIALVERVRTWSAAAELLTELARELAAGFPAGQAVDLAVEHTSAGDRAAALADRLGAAIPHLGRRHVLQASTAIRMHTGLGMLGVSVAPHPAVR